MERDELQKKILADYAAAHDALGENGTLALLESVRDYWRGLEAGKRDAFRFLHVSTDEVYGSLGDTGKFTETTPFAPNSPRTPWIPCGPDIQRRRPLPA